MKHGWYQRWQLHHAAYSGDLTVVRKLVERGYPINRFDEQGKTPLHYAVEAEHFEIVEFLIRSGANVNAQDDRSNGDTPLGEAAGECRLKMAKLLVESGADPVIRGWMKSNALDRAERRYREEGVGGEGQAVYDYLRKAVLRWK